MLRDFIFDVSIEIWIFLGGFITRIFDRRLASKDRMTDEWWKEEDL